MDVLAGLMPGLCLTVQYEEMIADPSGTLESVAAFCGLATKGVSIPKLGDDRGCAEPYLEFMATSDSS
jgi:hypothetical protein